MVINVLRKDNYVQATKQEWAVWMAVISSVFGINIYVGYPYVKTLLHSTIPLNYVRTTLNKNNVQLMDKDVLP